MAVVTRALELLGTVAVDDAAALIGALPEARWWELLVRQERSPTVHGDTQTVALRYREPGLEVVDHDLLTAFASLLDEIGALVGRRHPGRRALGNVLAVRLPAGAAVAVHHDRGTYLRAVHRIHVPLLTNGHCTFTAGDDEHRPRPGEVYELHNERPHGAANGGASPRIHLICDWLVDGDAAGR